MSEKSISVIIPAYKAGWCIENCLDSVEKQSMKPGKVLIGCDACEESFCKVQEIRDNYDFRSISLRTGDEVRVKRGDFKGLEGEITEVDTDSQRILVEGVDVATADETEVSNPIHPSNVEVIDLEDDDKRNKIIERRSENVEKRREEPSEENERA